MAGVATVLLHPYVTKDLRYPLGWDAMFYVWRGRAVPVDGLDRIGAIRAGFPLLTAVLAPLTRETVLTLVAVLPAILAGAAGLGSAGMARAAIGLSGPWMAVVGFLSWAAFGPNEIPLHHLDNLLNASLVLAAFAAALAFVEDGKGAGGAAVLLGAAGLAHWPFYLVAMAVYVPAVVAYGWRQRTDPLPGPARASPFPLLGAAGASAAVTGVLLLFPPDTGWLGARPGTLRTVLQERITARLDDPTRFYAFAVAAAGTVAVAAGPPARPRARRLFLWMVAAWALLTGAAVVAQIAGLPVAGARILSFFFPASILAALFVWWLAGWLVRRAGRTLGGSAGVARMGAVAVVVAAVVGFGTLLWTSWSTRHPWVEDRAVRQIATSARYVERFAPHREVVYVLDMKTRKDPATVGRWWLVVKATLPPGQVPRAHLYVGAPADYLARTPSRPLGAGLPPGESDRPDPGLWGPPGPAPVAIVLQRYNRAGFARERGSDPERVAGPGVLVLAGPLPGTPLGPSSARPAETGLRSLLAVSVVVMAILYLAGGGWALVLLPPDPVLQVAIAPSLGLATLTLAALCWVLIGLPLGTWGAAGVVLLAAGTGWVWAARARPVRRAEGIG